MVWKYGHKVQVSKVFICNEKVMHARMDAYNKLRRLTRRNIHAENETIVIDARYQCDDHEYRTPKSIIKYNNGKGKESVVELMNVLTLSLALRNPISFWILPVFLTIKDMVAACCACCCALKSTWRFLDFGISAMRAAGILYELLVLL